MTGSVPIFIISEALKRKASVRLIKHNILRPGSVIIQRRYPNCRLPSGLGGGRGVYTPDSDELRKYSVACGNENVVAALLGSNIKLNVRQYNGSSTLNVNGAQKALPKHKWIYLRDISMARLHVIQSMSG